MMPRNSSPLLFCLNYKLMGLFIAFAILILHNRMALQNTSIDILLIWV